MPEVKDAKSTSSIAKESSINEGSVFSGLLNPGLIGTVISSVGSEYRHRADNLRALNSTFESITKDYRLKELVDYCKNTGHSIPLTSDWSPDLNIGTGQMTFAITKDGGPKICDRLVDNDGYYKYGDGANFQPTNYQGKLSVALALRHAAFASHPTTVKTAFEEAVNAVRMGIQPAQEIESYRYAGV